MSDEEGEIVEASYKNGRVYVPKKVKNWLGLNDGEKVGFEKEETEEGPKVSVFRMVHIPADEYERLKE